MQAATGEDVAFIAALGIVAAGMLLATVVLPVYVAVKVTDAVTRPKSKNPARRIEELNY